MSAETCPDCGQPDHRSPEQVLRCQERLIVSLRDDVSAATARASELETKLDLTEGMFCRETKAANAHYARAKELERECEAWRKLAEWQTADQHVSWFARDGVHAYRFGNIVAKGDPVDVATKLGLIPDGKGETNG